MKTLAILLLSALTTFGAVVTNVLVDSQGNPITSQPTFTPLFGAYFDGTNTVIPTAVNPHVTTNGAISVSLAAGMWTYQWPGLPTLYGLVPATNATINLWTTVTNVFSNLVAQVSGHVLPGTNVVAVTNALGTPFETVTLSVSASLIANSAAYATNATLAINAITAGLATNAVSAGTATNATGLTLTTNSGPTLWTNPVVWAVWTNASGGTFWSPGYTNGH